MTGADVVRAREALGWKRTELARHAGLDYGRVVSIERSRMGWQGWKEGDELAIRRVLKDALERLEDLRGRPIMPDAAEAVAAARKTHNHGVRMPPPVPEAFDDSIVRETVWRGLVPGKLVRIDGNLKPYEQFKFVYHFKSPAQEYVQLHAVRNGGFRSVRPERVLVQTVRGWVPALEVSQ